MQEVGRKDYKTNIRQNKENERNQNLNDTLENKNYKLDKSILISSLREKIRKKEICKEKK